MSTGSRSRRPGYWVGAIIRDPNGRILLIWEPDKAKAGELGYLKFVGGTGEEDEFPRLTLYWELLEELKLDIASDAIEVEGRMIQEESTYDRYLFDVLVAPEILDRYVEKRMVIKGEKIFTFVFDYTELEGNERHILPKHRYILAELGKVIAECAETNKAA